MARHAHTFWLDDTDPRERALQRWLEDLACTREKASTIVEALLSHHAGAAGVTLITLNDKLDRLSTLLQSASPEQAAQRPARDTSTNHCTTGDGLTHLNNLGR